jgi:hypothetical protein
MTHDVIQREGASFLGEFGLKCDVEQDVAQLFPDPPIIALGNGIEELIGLLEQERCERLAGLRLIPRAPIRTTKSSEKCDKPFHAANMVRAFTTRNS